jgi:hypothetical protein
MLVSMKAKPKRVIINEALRQSRAEDAEDLSVLEARAKERHVSFEVFVNDLKKRGKL